ncbi:transmembrane protein 254 isoform X1 [Phyllobates terribilis]|uniref:transmembrane protein 254 isoform X1 n=1 Tax=Phyllobates terribilis TaxID=111132 RepID=UPI003CCB0487
MASAGSVSYFKRASILWMAVISLAMGFFTVSRSPSDNGDRSAGCAASAALSALCQQPGEWTVFWPEQVPYEQLGPVGSFSQYMVKNYYIVLYYGYWVSWAIHIAEALYSLPLCSSKGITDSGARVLWFIQTFLFGIASLSLLLTYKPGKKRR